MAKKLILLISLFLVACGYPASYPQQDIAEDTIWAAYDEDNEKPNVIWVHELNCHDGEGWTLLDGHCVAGLFYDFPLRVMVALPDKYIRDNGVPLYSKTALAHEYMHSHLKNLFGDANGAHNWSQWAEVYIVNTALEALEL